jgi:hypothetical protein
MEVAESTCQNEHKGKRDPTPVSCRRRRCPSHSLFHMSNRCRQRLQQRDRRLRHVRRSREEAGAVVSTAFSREPTKIRPGLISTQPRQTMKTKCIQCVQLACGLVAASTLVSCVAGHVDRVEDRYDRKENRYDRRHWSGPGDHYENRLDRREDVGDKARGRWGL